MERYYALFSGGLDSTLAILEVMASKRPIILTPLFFKFGQKSEEKEKEAISRLIPIMRDYLGSHISVIEDYREYDIRGLFSWSKSPILKHNGSNDGNPDVENRNMILIGCAASVVMSDWKSDGRKKQAKLVVGFKNEHYDTKQSFASSISEVFKNMGQPISIVTPLITEQQKRRSSYHRLAKEAHSLGVFNLLKQSWSCYYPEKGNPCDRCSACQGRNKFLKELEIRIEKKGEVSST